MRAMVLKEVGRALELMDIGLPIPRAGRFTMRRSAAASAGFTSRRR